MALAGVTVTGAIDGRFAEILSDEAVAFIADLHRRFNPTRKALLAVRAERQQRLNAGELPDFLPQTQSVREGDWKVGAIPADLQDRRVEITGPVDRKMVINALNSGARVFMADFEDSCTPTWENLIDGHCNLIDALGRTIALTTPEGKEYRLKESVAVLMVRPRGWHLVEKHITVDGEPISGSLMDFGLYLFHNHRRLKEMGSGPYYYLPKLESHKEARLWNDVFTYAEECLGLAHGTAKATVLIETILAAFEMEEILYELRDHIVGLNAGRWDYIYSVIKKFHSRSDMMLPDRAQVSMTVPFMRAYTELLIKTCHKRGAFAMGGMAAFIPSRKDPAVNEVALANVRADKTREATDGCDGTWVAHPDLVPVATEIFDAVLGARPNQADKQRPEVRVTARDLLNTAIPGGKVTEAGLRNNISVAILYIEAWLRGNGAVAIYNLMEDAATAEISRSQVWQWVYRGAVLSDGRVVTADLVRELGREEMEKIRTAVGEGPFAAGQYEKAHALFERLALADRYEEFLTIPAYAELD